MAILNDAIRSPRFLIGGSWVGVLNRNEVLESQL